MNDVSTTDAPAADCAVALGPDGRVLDWSPAAERTFGLERAEALGQTLEALIGVPPEATAGDTAGQRVEVEARHRQGHIVVCGLSVHLLRLPGGAHRLVCLRPSGACERELQQASAHAVALSAAMTELAGACAEDELAAVLARCGRPAVPHDATLFLEGGGDLRAHPVRLPGEDAPAARSAADAPARAAMDRGQTLVLSGPQLPHAGWPGTLVVLPLRVGGRAQGALALAFEQGPPGGRQLQFLEHLAAQCAHALGNLRAHAALHESEARFRATFNQAAVGIAQTGLDGRWLNVNDKLCEIVGRSRPELLALRFQDITHPDDLESDLEHVGQLLGGARRTYALQKRYLRGDGEPVWVNLTVSLVRGEDGAPRYFIAVIEDITAVKATEAELVQARDELEQRVAERTAALQAIGAQLQRQVQELELRSEEARLLGKMGEMLQSCVHLEEARQVVARYAARLFPGASGALYTFGASGTVLEMESWNGPSASFAVFSPTECWALRRGRLFVREAGRPGPVCGHLPSGHGESTLCAPLLAQGEPVGLLHLSQPQAFGEAQERLARTVAETAALATVNLRLRETLQQQSIRDPLTGLFNRRHLEETFEREAHRARRYGHGIGVMMMDVDHFKRFNDTFGHEAGDALLRELARVLQAGVRGEDVVCRYGGEEFALLLPGASREQTVARAEQLRLSVRDMRVSSRGEALDSVSASFGVATFPEHGEGLYDLLRTADAALYRAKQEGRNRVVVA